MVHEISAPAKINLYLRVLGRRPDGYHEIDSVLQMVGLYDELRFEERPGPGKSGIEMVASGEPMPEGGENLIIKAAELLRARRPRGGGVRILVTKRIPLAAGLGGASSDAAAVLVMLNRIWKIGLPTRALAALGGRLGSDIPFFFHGPTARVSGRGTHVARLSLSGDRWVVLVNPGLAVQTGSVYHDLNAGPVQRAPAAGSGVVGAGPARPIRWAGITRMLRNDLGVVTERRHPVIGTIKAALTAAGAAGVLMSGSGPTVFGLFRDKAEAVQAAGLVGPGRGWRVWVVPTLSASPLA